MRASPPGLPTNLIRDQKTVAAMVRIYCRDHHAAGGLCGDCGRLLDYALGRLARCPYGAEKTTCRECPIHCYRPTERATIRDVMRYSGPRMLWRRPLLALRHLWIERQGPPRRPARASRDDVRTTATAPDSGS